MPDGEHVFIDLLAGMDEELARAGRAREDRGAAMKVRVMISLLDVINGPWEAIWIRDFDLPALPRQGEAVFMDDYHLGDVRSVTWDLNTLTPTVSTRTHVDIAAWGEIEDEVEYVDWLDANFTHGRSTPTRDHLTSVKGAYVNSRRQR